MGPVKQEHPRELVEQIESDADGRLERPTLVQMQAEAGTEKVEPSGPRAPDEPEQMR